MPNRKVTYHLYPSTVQAERLGMMRGLHQRLYARRGRDASACIRKPVRICRPPATLLTMIRTQAEEAGSWYEELPTRELKTTQRCYGPYLHAEGVVRGPQCGCRQLPDTKKAPSDRHHPCPHCAATYGRDDNATRGGGAALDGSPIIRAGTVCGVEWWRFHRGPAIAGNEHETLALAV